MQGGLNERCAAESFQNPVSRPSGAAHIFIYSHAFAMGRMASDCGANLAVLALNLAADDRVIDLVDAAARELRRKCRMGFVGLGHNQAAAGVLIEAVNDAWPGHPAYPAELAFAMVKQGIHEGMFLVPGGRMHHQTGWFVQHE